MAWSGNFRPFVPPGGEHTLTSIYNHDFDPFQGVLEVKHRPEEVPLVLPSNNSSNNNMMMSERKRRMTDDQIETLERSFLEEMKLEPERKMRLARELRLQPRQVAVWFQNRRARWKTKQLERLYDALKTEFLHIAKEKQKLQEEVMKLKAKLENQPMTQSSACYSYTEASPEETVESKSIGIRSSSKLQLHGDNYYQIGQCNYLSNVDDCYDCNPAFPPYWGVLASYP